MKIENATPGMLIQYVGARAGIGRPEKLMWVLVDSIDVNHVSGAVHVRGHFVVGKGFSNEGHAYDGTRYFEMGTEVKSYGVPVDTTTPEPQVAEADDAEAAIEMPGTVASWLIETDVAVSNLAYSEHEGEWRNAFWDAYNYRQGRKHGRGWVYTFKVSRESAKELALEMKERSCAESQYASQDRGINPATLWNFALKVERSLSK